jgi:dTDP-4-amino-4,6-dideoxygalactose transaminase
VTLGTTPKVSEIPFVDLARHHAAIERDLRLAVDAVLESGDFVLGARVREFERSFASYCGVGHCVGTASGTAALTLALRAFGIGRGDEVIVPAHTFIATALAVVDVGATPVLCDVHDGTGLIDPESAAEVVSPRTAAIVPVHLYGQVCEMELVRALADARGLVVIEDAAQAHGATRGSARAGSLGDAAAFSFYPSKNLGALGDGGAVCTHHDDVAMRLRRFGNLGQSHKGEHLEVGSNERLDEIQAAVLSVKLSRLDACNARRRELAALYRERLPVDARPLEEDARGTCVYHLFPIRVGDRDWVREGLSRLGVETGIHYWPALHQQPPLRLLAAPRTELHRARAWSEQVLTLPMFAELTADEVEAVSRTLSEVRASAC